LPGVPVLYGSVNKFSLSFDLAMLIRFITIAFARGTPAIGVLIFSLLLAARVSLVDASRVFFALNVLYLLAIFSRFGLDTYVLRHVGLYNCNSQPPVRSLVFQIVLLTLLLSSFVSFVAFSVASYLGYAIDTVNLCFLLALPPFTVLGIGSFALRAAGWERTGALLEVSSVSLMASLMLLPFVFMVDLEVSYFAVCFLASSIILSVSSLIICWSTMDKGGSLLAGGQLLKGVRESSHYWYTAMSCYLLQWYPVFIAPFYHPEWVAFFNVANRLSTLINFVGVTVDAIAAPRFAYLLKSGNKLEIERLLRSFFWIVLLFVFLFITLFVLVGSWALQSYFADFEAIYLPSILLMSLYGCSILLGPAGYLLSMGGHGHLVGGGTIGVTIVSFGLCPLFMWAFGFWGLVLSVGSLALLRNILFVALAKKLTGVSFPCDRLCHIFRSEVRSS